MTLANSSILSTHYKRTNCPTPELYRIRNSPIAIVNELRNLQINNEILKTLTSGGYDEISYANKVLSIHQKNCLKQVIFV